MCVRGVYVMWVDAVLDELTMCPCTGVILNDGCNDAMGEDMCCVCLDVTLSVLCVCRSHSLVCRSQTCAQLAISL